MPAASGFDRIDIANQIRNRYIRRREFLHVAFVRGEKGNGSFVAESDHLLAAAPADWGVGIVMNLASRQVRHLRIEQRRQRAQDAALGLAAQPKKDEIVSRKNSVDDLRHYGVVVSDDPGKNRLLPARAQPDHQVVSQLVFQPACTQTLSRK